ncbi:protein transport protein sec31-like isoform X2 [Heterocephalus glaber]|uniref:Protein transport protein sec31-like isoform X2 n=1 Tax=Heterocephalus glaber TaxID=10181 RepID=A0AAX6T7Z5_HETGA|nr:protein transport protein sec31-like isoform X2 [Heterocephalus glaber]
MRTGEKTVTTTRGKSRLEGLEEWHSGKEETGPAHLRPPPASDASPPDSESPGLAPAPPTAGSTHNGLAQLKPRCGFGLRPPQPAPRPQVPPSLGSRFRSPEAPPASGRRPKRRQGLSEGRERLCGHAQEPCLCATGPRDLQPLRAAPGVDRSLPWSRLSASAWPGLLTKGRLPFVLHHAPNLCLLSIASSSLNLPEQIPVPLQMSSSSIRQNERIFQKVINESGLFGQNGLSKDQSRKCLRWG